MEIGSSSHRGLFSPIKQGEFWGKVTPDLRGMLQFFELKENWTIPYNELPEFYESIDKIILAIQQDGDKEQDEVLLDRLIVLFGSMPLKQCMTGLSWIDKGITKDSDIRWAGSIYFRASDVINDGHNDEYVRSHSHVIKERVELISRMNLLNSLFSKLEI